MAADRKKRSDHVVQAQPTRGGAAWIDERALDRGDMRVAQGFSKLRADAAFDAATGCDDCIAERTRSGDAETLCEAHLAQAMGMTSNW